jgi:hypothetical protein
VTRVPICLFVALTMLPATAAHAEPAPVVASAPVIQASLVRIAKRSALWREAMDAVRIAGRRVVVLTPDQVRFAGRADQGEEHFDTTSLAEVAPVLRANGQVDTVLVVVNLRALQDAHEDQNLLPIEFEMDLDRVLVHEIYGHAVPYLLAGHVSGRCADPAPGERASDACSIRRENAVRAELGLGRRVDYGLNGLSVARRLRQ